MSFPTILMVIYSFWRVNEQKIKAVSSQNQRACAPFCSRTQKAVRVFDRCEPKANSWRILEALYMVLYIYLCEPIIIYGRYYIYIW